MDNTYERPRVRSLRTRVAAVLALVGAVLLSSGLVVMTAPTASAKDNAKDNEVTKTCPDGGGWTKVDNKSGTVSNVDPDPAADLTWAGKTLDYDLAPGHSVELCIKSGDKAFESGEKTEVFTLTGKSSVTIGQDISHISYRVTYTPPTVTAVAPSVSQSTQCEVEGTYTIPNTAGVQYKLDGASIAAGTYPGPKSGTITAVATGDNQLTDPEFSFALNVPAAADCDTPPNSTAVNPSVAQSAACGVQGSYTIPNTAGVQYKLNGANIAPGMHQGPATGTITAMATGNHVLANPAFSFSLNVPAAEVCSTATPAVVAPTQAAPPVILGTESASPKPTKKPAPKPAVKGTQAAAPQVLGTQAAVPTAVDAGLGSLPAAAPAQDSPLGQLLTTVGVALMLAAGWLLMGRRQAGVREA